MNLIRRNVNINILKLVIISLYKIIRNHIQIILDLFFAPKRENVGNIFLFIFSFNEMVIIMTDVLLSNSIIQYNKFS